MRIKARPSLPGAMRVYGVSIVAVLALSACDGGVPLQMAADPGKASEMAAVLGEHGIEVERKPEKSGVLLSVAGSELPRAMRVLREAGLLRRPRASIDETWGKNAFAPTPLEAQSRRVHAIERDLEATLMDIDGVVAARVRIVPPERPAPGAPIDSASASVFVKHRPDVDLSPLVPGIASLVKNGAPGLAGADDRRIAVVLVPEQPIVHVPAAPGAGAIDLSASRWVAVCAACAALGFFVDRSIRRVGLKRRGRRVDGERHVSTGD